ncbi:MAG: hypothetical protein H6625_02070 [Bdellovibrionaceae bacterium]|nr:hypothetical protein [Pseudobdellovibrionaceae bacterium]
MKSFLKVIFLFLLAYSPLLLAQEGENVPFNANYELGAQIGSLLPNQVPGASEIQPQWGLRAGFGMGGAGTTEFTANAGNGEGVSWKQLSLSFRMDMPIEELVGIVYIGGDMIIYETLTQEQKIFGGGHVGGGVMSVVSRDLWFRVDMKFNVNPGTSLFIGGGFTFRFGEAATE